MNEQFECIQCKKSFINKCHKNTRKFCSKSCWATYCNRNIKRPKKTQSISLFCIKCGIQFIVLRRYMKIRKYCSKSCARSKLEYLPKKCPCGKIIITKNINKVYCSLSCRSKYRMRKGIYSLPKHKQVCKMCGKTFSKYQQSIFCSKKCHTEHCRTQEYRIKESMKQTKEKIFNGFKQKNRLRDMGRKEYIKWRNAVFYRDNYKCQKCNSVKKLEAHHLKSYSKFPELRYDVSNGITLCKECHQQVDKVRYLFFKKEASYAV